MSSASAGSLDRRHLALLACVSLAVLLAGTWALPLLDRDEPRFARATVEMMQRGDWVVPWFNDGYRFDKPPLTYWLMRGGYALFGIGELGARLHSVISSLAVCLLLYAFGSRMLGKRAALLAAFAWATSLQVVLHGRLALADMPMVLAVLLAQWSLWELLLRAPVSAWGPWFWTLWISLGIGFLAKGPIAVAVPALTLLFLRLFRGRQGLPWRRLQAAPGVLLSLAIIAAWGIPALLRTGGAFWDVGIGEHVVRRGMESFNDRPVLPFYYLVTVFLSLFPWSASLGRLPAFIRRGWASDDTRFLVAWILGPYLVFSFYTTQLPHYTMPAFPAILLLLFREAPTAARPSRLAGGIGWTITVLFAALALGILAFMTVMPPQGEAAVLRAPLMLLAAALLALQATALRVWRADRGEAVLPASAVATALLAALLLGGFAVTVRPAALPLRIQAVVAGMPPEARLIARGYGEPSLVFYAGAPWDLAGEPASARMFDGDAPTLLLVRSGETPLDRLLLAAGELPPADVDAALGRAGLRSVLAGPGLQRQVVRGFNFARASWTEVVVVWRP